MNQSMKRCAVCYHEKRCEIERDIIKGVPYAILSKKYGIKEQCITDHKARGHIPAGLSEEAIKKRSEDLTALLDECLEISIGSAREARAAKAYGAVGSIMAGPYKVLERSPGRVEETGLEAMRKEMEARRNVAPTT
jgi:hypothetical protein